MAAGADSPLVARRPPALAIPTFVCSAIAESAFCKVLKHFAVIITVDAFVFVRGDINTECTMTRLGILILFVGFVQLADVDAGDTQSRILNFEISPESRFTFLPSPESAGIPGCDPNDFQCDFQVSGTVSLNLRDDFLFFAHSNLDVAGNEAIQKDPPFLEALVTSDRIEERLAQTIMSRQGPNSFQSIFRFGNSFRAELAENELKLTGGIDLTPSDGLGFDFDLQANKSEPTGGVYSVRYRFAGEQNHPFIEQGGYRRPLGVEPLWPQESAS